MELTFPKVFLKRQYTNEKQLEESIQFFRQIGFFEQWQKNTDEGIIQKINRLCKEGGVPSLSVLRKPKDLDIIIWDKKRVWFDDADALVLPKNEAYVQALQELAGISRKQFHPTAIEEIWKGEDGPIQVRYTCKRKKYECAPRFLDTYFDYGILKDINIVLQDTRFRFEMTEGPLGNPMVLLLHEEERELLSERRGWKFIDC
jgi:hypothetical protein